MWKKIKTDKIIRETHATNSRYETYGREKLNDLGYKTRNCSCQSGEDKPLYELGITGILQKHWILP
jgi:hypothetical protein